MGRLGYPHCVHVCVFEGGPGVVLGGGEKRETRRKERGGEGGKGAGREGERGGGREGGGRDGELRNEDVHVHVGICS